MVLRWCCSYFGFGMRYHDAVCKVWSSVRFCRCCPLRMAVIVASPRFHFMSSFWCDVVVAGELGPQ